MAKQKHTYLPSSTVIKVLDYITEAQAVKTDAMAVLRLQLRTAGRLTNRLTFSNATTLMQVITDRYVYGKVPEKRAFPARKATVPATAPAPQVAQG